MAEAFGVVAGALGLVSVIKEIKNGINTLQQIRDNAGKVPSQIQSLTDDLGFLLIVLEELAKRHGADHPIVQHCKTCCDDVASRLTLLQDKIPKLQGSKLKQFRFAMRGLKVDLEELQISLGRAKANMSLAAAIPVLTVLETTRIQTVEDESPKVLETRPSTAVAPSFNARRPIRRGCWVGSMRRCFCSCHDTNTYSLGFLTLEYTPIRQKCDNETCDSWTFGSSVKLGLTSFGLLWKVIVQAQMLHRDGNTTLQPGLLIQRLIPRENPGFEAISEFFQGSVSLDGLKHTLTTMARNDPTFRHHVTPDGDAYVSHLLGGTVTNTYRKVPNDTIFELLSFMICDLKLTRDLYSKHFLALCKMVTVPTIRWDRSPPSTILEHLVSEGLELQDIQWPMPGDFWPDLGNPWLSSDTTSMGFLSTIARHCPEFAGMTPLHDAALIGSVESVKTWKSRSPPDQTNFLGQTALHLSVLNPEKVSILIEANFDLNAMDTSGDRIRRTPLVYTAIMGATESAILLIEAGADLGLTPRLSSGAGFSYVASRCGKWQYLLDILPSIRGRLGGSVAKPLIEAMAVSWATETRVQASDHLFGQMINTYQCANMVIPQNFPFRRPYGPTGGDTLMHLALTAGRARELLAAGFTLINHANNQGKTPLVSVSSVFSSQNPAAIAQVLVDAGADVHLFDRHQRTALLHSFIGLRGSQETQMLLFSSIRQLARVLLQAGADLFAGDSCICACSPSGCLPSVAACIIPPSCLSSAAGANVQFLLPFASLESILLAWEWKGKQTAKDCLLSALRLRKHEQLGMTHVCCRGSQDTGLYQDEWAMSDEDRMDILDEESEFTALLDQDMSEIEALSIADLEEIWFCQLRDDFNASKEEDCSVRDMDEPDGPCEDSEQDDTVVVQAAVYKYGIAFETFFGLDPTPEEHRWRLWLRVRLGYLSRLLRAVGISLEDVSGKMPMLLSPEAAEYNVAPLPEDITEERRKAFVNCLDSWEGVLEADEVADESAVLGGLTEN